MAVYTFEALTRGVEVQAAPADRTATGKQSTRNLAAYVAMADEARTFVFYGVCWQHIWQHISISSRRLLYKGL